jgi:hypothetical protein
MDGAGTLNTGRHSGAGGISPGARSSLIQAGAEYKGGEYGATMLLVVARQFSTAAKFKIKPLE